MGLTTLLIRMRYGGLGYNPHIIRQPRKRSEPRGDEDFQMASNRQKKKRRLSRMMYPFMTLDDGTEVVHSEAYVENNMEKVKVYFEKPVEGGFESAYCYLPEYRWDQIIGFSEDEIAKMREYLGSVAHIIIELSRQGGFENAVSF